MKCILPGCQKPKFCDYNKNVYDFCGKPHAEEAKQNAGKIN